MFLYVLFGQRKENYPGQYAPEALEVMDEYAYHENGEWLQEKLLEGEKTGEFAALKIMEINLGSGSQDRIREALVGTPVLKGTLVND